MARRRTTYCRYCYTEGHTKRGCPKVKEIVKANPNSYLADSLKRHCSWCRSTEHTKVKCPEYIEHIRLKRIELLENRAVFCEELSQHGLAPGALVTAEFYDQTERRWKYAVSIVENVEWEHAHKRSSKFIHLSCLNFQGHETVGVPNWDYSYVKVISPMSSEFARSYHTKQMEKTNDKVCSYIK